MNLEFRERLALVVAKAVGVRVSVVCSGVRFSNKLVKSRTVSLNQRTRECNEFSGACADWLVRWRSVGIDPTSPDADCENLRPQASTTRAVLMKEREHLLSVASRLKREPLLLKVTGPIVEYIKASTGASLLSLGSSLDSLSRIISRTDSETFYWDLLLWLLVPSMRIEELLGDLNEEYLLRVSEVSDAEARAWYQYQAVHTIVHYFWKRLERVAAIATLADFVARWFRK
jgi:hypothetical protein